MTSTKSKKPKRIGIYAGTFDPVHAGHVAFGLQAIEAAELDRLYFMPERQPRGKSGVEHFAHRVAMIKRASMPHTKFDVLELVDVNFTVERTLPKLEVQFKGDQLVFLFGSDIAKNLPSWGRIERLLSTSELVIGVRASDEIEVMKQEISNWPIPPKAAVIFESYAADVSSGAVRDGLRARQTPRGLLKSVARYSDRHWLYVSLSR